MNIIIFYFFAWTSQGICNRLRLVYEPCLRGTSTLHAHSTADSSYTHRRPTKRRARIYGHRGRGKAECRDRFHWHICTKLARLSSRRIEGVCRVEMVLVHVVLDCRLQITLSVKRNSKEWPQPRAGQEREDENNSPDSYTHAAPPTHPPARPHSALPASATRASYRHNT